MEEALDFSSELILQSQEPLIITVLIVLTPWYCWVKPNVPFVILNRNL